MSEPADVAVIGLGGIGGQVAWRVATTGRSVVGFDAHRPPHTVGSSHGFSRAIREAYFEGEQYVPLVRRAFELWADLERRLGRTLLHTTGCVALGPADGVLVRGLEAASAAHGIPLDPLSARDRSVFTLGPGVVGLRERRAGWLEVEPAVAGALALAAAAGAELHLDTPVLALDRSGEHPVVVTADGAHPARRVVVAAGAWATDLVPGLPLTVERQVLLWFDPPPHSPDSIWVAELPGGAYAYGFPPDVDGLKLALHHGGPAVTPDRVDRTVRAEDETALREAVAGVLGPLGPVRRSVVCLYTNTADEHFAIGPLPEDPRIVLASACSGHGFKFLPATGEAVAALALGEAPPVDVSSFAPARLTGP